MDDALSQPEQPPRPPSRVPPGTTWAPTWAPRRPLTDAPTRCRDSLYLGSMSCPVVGPAGGLLLHCGRGRHCCSFCCCMGEVQVAHCSLSIITHHQRHPTPVITLATLVSLPPPKKNPSTINFTPISYQRKNVPKSLHIVPSCAS